MAEEKVLDKSVDYIFTAYFMTYKIAFERAREKKIPFPEEIPPPSFFYGKTMNNSDDFIAISNAVASLGEFVATHNLRDENVKLEDIEKVIIENADKDNSNGRCIRGLLDNNDKMIEDMKIRVKVEALLNFETKKTELLNALEENKAIIKRAADAIKKQNFPVDGEKLIKNYLNASKLNAKKAYEMLITNPASFSPLLLDKAKRGFIFKTKPSPEEAHKINRDLGKFLKNLKI